jgi:tRNA A-37 threonylcarbamoyl transferase component Bud32
MPDQGAFNSNSSSSSCRNTDTFISSSPDDSDIRTHRNSNSNNNNVITSQPSPTHSARKGKKEKERSAPECPPTPERTALWLHIDDNHPDYYDQSGADSFLAGQQQQQQGPNSPHDEEFDDFSLSRPILSSSSSQDGFRRDASIPLPMRRQNSLIDTKILASSTVPRAPRSFGEEEQRASSAWGGADTEHTDILFDRDFVNKGIIGSGTFAEVFKCTLKNGSNESFAIKKSRRQFRSKRDRAEFLSEVHIMQIVGATECPYLIQFYRAWQENSYFYVQIELAERGTLRDLMNSHSYAKQIVQDKTVVRVLHDVASGLEHIHQCGVVHLDIKPQNILISLDGTVKIGDFGIAMAQGTDGDEGHEGDTR